MSIDFSYLEGAAPQEERTPVMSDTANVTIRVDADSMLLCDGEYIDQPFKAGALTKIQLPIGQHLLEFLYTEDPDIKVEKEVDFPEAGKSYLVLIKGLKDLVDAAAAEAKQKAEEEARKKAEEEARKKAEAEAKRKAEEEAEAEAKRKAEEARKKAEEEAKRKAEIKKIVDLAEDYYHGRNGKSKDYKKAVANYLIAAEAGDAFSLYSLGWCYEKGQGVEQSTQEAEKWYRKAAAKGESKAKERLEIILKEEKRKEKSGAINGHDYVDLGLPSGLKWATCNVGADSPEKYGDYYAWGEVNIKWEYTRYNNKTYHKRISDISGNSTYDVARKKWGSSWRMPTEDEILELMSKCKFLWTTKGRKNGYKVFGPNGNTLFLPAAGIRINSEVYNAGKEGNYWSSKPEKDYNGTCAHYLHFYKSEYKIESTQRYFGLSVRPVSK